MVETEHGHDSGKYLHDCRSVSPDTLQPLLEPGATVVVIGFSGNKLTNSIRTNGNTYNEIQCD